MGVKRRPDGPFPTLSRRRERGSKTKSGERQLRAENKGAGPSVFASLTQLPTSPPDERGSSVRRECPIQARARGVTSPWKGEVPERSEGDGGQAPARRPFSPPSPAGGRGDQKPRAASGELRAERRARQPPVLVPQPSLRSDSSPGSHRVSTCEEEGRLFSNATRRLSW